MLKIVCLVFFFALNLFSSDFNEQKINFEIFLTTITGYPQLDINIELTDEFIFLSGSLDKVEQFKNALDNALSSRKKLESIINYKICVDDSNENRECPLEQPASFTLTSIAQGKKQLQNLLGDALDEVCLDLDKFFNENIGATVQKGALCSRIFTTSSGTKNIHEAMREKLLSCFANKTCLDIRRAWSGEEKLMPCCEGIEEKNDSIFGLINQLFTLTPLNASQHYFRIDLEGIFNLCHPPLSKITIAANGSATLSVNKLHLLSYIKQLILGNVLLRVSKNSEGISASPMIISTKHALNRTTTHYLVIDISESMESVMSDLKIYLSIGELKKILSDNALHMSSEHTFINFITKLGEEVIRESRFSVSNQQTGIFMPDIVFEQKKDLDATFCCGEQKVSEFYEQKIKQSDIFDHMKSLRANAIKIAKNSNFSLNQRQTKLQTILNQVLSFNDGITPFSQQKYIADTKKNIYRLIDLIKEAKNDYSLARSLEVSIATLTGIY